MYVITVHQKSIVSVLTGVQTVENRRRGTRYRGRLAIRVGRAWCGGTTERTPVRDRLDAEASELLHKDSHLCEIVFRGGCVVAVAELVDCHHDTGTCCAPWGDRGRWHLVLRDLTPLTEPVPADGVTGVRSLPPEIAAAVEARLGEGHGGLG